MLALIKNQSGQGMTETAVLFFGVILGGYFMASQMNLLYALTTYIRGFYLILALPVG